MGTDAYRTLKPYLSFLRNGLQQRFKHSFSDLIVILHRRYADATPIKG